MNNSELIIKRYIKDKRFIIADLTEVRAVTDDEMPEAIRTFGFGRLFGYLRTFDNSEFGSFTAYSTQRKNRILICLNNGKNKGYT